MSITDRGSRCRTKPFTGLPQKGFTLIETIVFLLVVGIGVVGLLSAISTSVRYSADPLPQKQALAIAEALMEEITSAGFTFCRAGTPNFESATAADVANCGTGNVEDVGIGGAEAGEVRPFDNVNDYVSAFGAAPAGISVTPIGLAMPAPAGYGATLSIAQAGLSSIGTSEALLISLTVTGPNNTRVVLDSYRTRYAPRVSP